MTDRPTIYIEFSDTGTIRKWSCEPFEGGVEYVREAGAEIARLRASLKPFAEKQTCAEILADPAPPVWSNLPLQERAAFLGARKEQNDAQILAARAALENRT
jgi:hypothetical protein